MHRAWLLNFHRTSVLIVGLWRWGWTAASSWQGTITHGLRFRHDHSWGTGRHAEDGGVWSEVAPIWQAAYCQRTASFWHRWRWAACHRPDFGLHITNRIHSIKTTIIWHLKTSQNLDGKLRLHDCWPPLPRAAKFNIIHRTKFIFRYFSLRCKVL